jgi:hypothetical protein
MARLPARSFKLDGDSPTGYVTGPGIVDSWRLLALSDMGMREAAHPRLRSGFATAPSRSSAFVPVGSAG